MSPAADLLVRRLAVADVQRHAPVPGHAPGTHPVRETDGHVAADVAPGGLQPHPQARGALHCIGSDDAAEL